MSRHQSLDLLLPLQGPDPLGYPLRDRYFAKFHILLIFPMIALAAGPAYWFWTYCQILVLVFCAVTPVQCSTAIFSKPTCVVFYWNRFVQALNLSKDHKPDLEVEKDRILKAGGFIQVGRVNGSLNLARAIGNYIYFSIGK